MTPIVGYVKLLLDEELGPLNKPQGKALRAMDDCVRRLRAIIDNLLDVTGLETGKLRFFHVEYDFLDTTRRAVAHVADKLEESKLTLVEELPRGPLTAIGDAGRLQRAIVQLLENAAKFTPAGGTVGVRVSRLASGHYELCVADTGPGIPPNRQARIFEPFYQVDGSPPRLHGGVGVGLAIVRRTARGLGGDVRLALRAAIIDGSAPHRRGLPPHRRRTPFNERRLPTCTSPAHLRRLMPSVYLDWNATTPPHPDVLEAMRAAAARRLGQPVERPRRRPRRAPPRRGRPRGRRRPRRREPPRRPLHLRRHRGQQPRARPPVRRRARRRCGGRRGGGGGLG